MKGNRFICCVLLAALIIAIVIEIVVPLYRVCEALGNLSGEPHSFLLGKGCMLEMSGRKIPADEILKRVPKEPKWKSL
jgi:hypothetical protein